MYLFDVLDDLVTFDWSYEMMKNLTIYVFTIIYLLYVFTIIYYYLLTIYQKFWREKILTNYS